MKFYAMYHPYGARALSGHNFLAFNSKKARDDFVDKNEWRGSNIVWTACTRREVIAELGENFIIDDKGQCDKSHH